MNFIIRQYLVNMETLSGTLNQHLNRKPKRAPKQVLLQAWGRDDCGGWLLLNGLAKQYRYTDEGKVLVTGFWKKNDVILLPQSFFTGQEAGDYIELIEDSMLMSFQAKDIIHLDTTLQELKLIPAILTVYVERADLHLRLIGMNTGQALKHLAAMYPLNRIRNKDIASFLLKDPSSLYRATR